MLKRLLAHPLTNSLDIDEPVTTWLRRRIIKEKPFLRKIYEEWYRTLAQALPRGTEPVLEIGSGAGFLDTFIPNLITSEVFFCSNVKILLDAASLPFRDGSLRAVVMTNVLHHLPQPRSFLAEATRCVRPGGVLALIEPWVSPWSRFIYGYLHHEPFRPDSDEWEFCSPGPLSGANGAVPWMIFERDREKAAREFPEWKIQYIKPSMPFCYLCSGGVSMRSFMPGAAFNLVRRIENQPLMRRWAMFAEIRLERVEPLKMDRASAGGN